VAITGPVCLFTDAPSLRVCGEQTRHARVTARRRGRRDALRAGRSRHGEDAGESSKDPHPARRKSLFIKGQRSRVVDSAVALARWRRVAPDTSRSVVDSSAGEMRGPRVAARRPGSASDQLSAARRGAGDSCGGVGLPAGAAGDGRLCVCVCVRARARARACVQLQVTAAFRCCSPARAACAHAYGAAARRAARCGAVFCPAYTAL
jgi:hypothetical protein